MLRRGGGGGRGGAAVLYGAVAGTGGAEVYMRLRGWSLGDMLYVTRAGLKKSISQVTDGAQATHLGLARV